MALGTQHFVFSQGNRFQICSGEDSKGKEKSSRRNVNKQEMVEKRLCITRSTALEGHVFCCVKLDMYVQCVICRLLDTAPFDL